MFPTTFESRRIAEVAEATIRRLVCCGITRDGTNVPMLLEDKWRNKCFFQVLISHICVSCQFLPIYSLSLLHLVPHNLDNIQGHLENNTLANDIWVWDADSQIWGNNIKYKCLKMAWKMFGFKKHYITREVLIFTASAMLFGWWHLRYLSAEHSANA
jgi:hypothetical protein